MSTQIQCGGVSEWMFQWPSTSLAVVKLAVPNSFQVFRKGKGTCPHSRLAYVASAGRACKFWRWNPAFSVLPFGLIISSKIHEISFKAINLFGSPRFQLSESESVSQEWKHFFIKQASLSLSLLGDGQRMQCVCTVRPVPKALLLILLQFLHSKSSIAFWHNFWEWLPDDRYGLNLGLNFELCNTPDKLVLKVLFPPNLS